MIEHITNFIIKSFPRPWPGEAPDSRLLVLRLKLWAKLLKLAVVMFFASLEMTRQFITWLIAYVRSQPLPISIFISVLVCLVLGYGSYVFFSDKNRHWKKRQKQSQPA